MQLKSNLNVLASKADKSHTPALIIGTLAFQAINTVLLLMGGLILLALAFKPTPTLVQLVDGTPVQVTARDRMERSPETIHRFIADFINLMFSWTGTLPPETIDQAKSPPFDPGVALSATTLNKKLATSSFQAGFALSEDFRKPFLESVADITPQDLFGKRLNADTVPTQVVPLIKYISDPQTVKPGVWTVNVVANLVIFTDRDRTGKVTPFNKQISLRAIEPPLKPGPTALEKQIFAIRRAGLEVIAIRDLES